MAHCHLPLLGLLEKECEDGLCLGHQSSLFESLIVPRWSLRKDFSFDGLAVLVPTHVPVTTSHSNGSSSFCYSSFILSFSTFFRHSSNSLWNVFSSNFWFVVAIVSDSCIINLLVKPPMVEFVVVVDSWTLMLESICFNISTIFCQYGKVFYHLCSEVICGSWVSCRLDLDSKFIFVPNSIFPLFRNTNSNNCWCFDPLPFLVTIFLRKHTR